MRKEKKNQIARKERKPGPTRSKMVEFLRCPNCREELIDLKYLDYYGGVCQKCGYDFYTGWTWR